MGASQSVEEEKSRVTLERESFNVVLVTDDVVQRLSSSSASAKAPPASHSDKDDEGSRSIESASPLTADLKSALDEERALTSRLSRDLGSSRRELENLKDKVRRLESDFTSQGGVNPRSNQDYYQKLKDLTERQKQLQEAMKKQFKDTVDEVSKKFFAQECETACAGLQSSLLRCYMDNPKATLNCHTLARDFVRCVDEYRREMLARSA